MVVNWTSDTQKLILGIVLRGMAMPVVNVRFRKTKYLAKITELVRKG